eukprot:g80348.t1
MAQAEEIRTETGPLDYDYTEKEVELCQENLQNHKACSPDKIKNEMLKYGGTRIVSFLLDSFNSSLAITAATSFGVAPRLLYILILTKHIYNVIHDIGMERNFMAVHLSPVWF